MAFGILVAVVVLPVLLLDIFAIPRGLRGPTQRLSFKGLAKLEQYKESRNARASIIAKLVVLVGFVSLAIWVMCSEAPPAIETKTAFYTLDQECADQHGLLLTASSTAGFFQFGSSKWSGSDVHSANSARATEDALQICLTKAQPPIPTALASFLFSVLLYIRELLDIHKYDDVVYENMVSDALDFEICCHWKDTSAGLMNKLYHIAALAPEHFAVLSEFMAKPEGCHIDKTVARGVSLEHYKAMRVAFCFDAPESKTAPIA
ncbi:hypothetical protein JKP88DRAFT_254117 [Tribonema minus]|uniref:Uncharacterized protein n=1 Tax=Tribonema minus TaxID=303371 RepID=A0A835Z674_9STRA|nr:hypothetical protein JKP88DRAFT_254117 [Tribonema minus]